MRLLKEVGMTLTSRIALSMLFDTQIALSLLQIDFQSKTFDSYGFKST